MHLNNTLLSSISLKDTQIREFKKAGYLIVRGGYSDTEVKLLQNWCSELLALPEESGKHCVYRETHSNNKNTKIVNRIENITPFHSGFKALSESLKNPVGQLLEEEATLFKEKINFKMSGGAGFEPHQDIQAGWGKYAKFFISAFVSIDESTVENGCLEFCKTPKHSKTYKSWEPLSLEEVEELHFTPILTKPGDLVFFNCFAIHQSSENRSTRCRRIYYATYNKRSDGDHLEKYYRDKHETYPPDIDRREDMKYVFKV